MCLQNVFTIFLIQILLVKKVMTKKQKFTVSIQSVLLQNRQYKSIVSKSNVRSYV